MSGEVYTIGADQDISVTFSQSGPAGSSGTAGTSGTSGSSGSSGTHGTSGSSGSSGTAGTSSVILSNNDQYVLANQVFG